MGTVRIESREDAVMLREVLAPIWVEYYAANGDRDTVVSTNMCCRTAAMIVEIDPSWRVVHGTVHDQPHAWCQRADGLVLDLTADQFGGPTVVWAPLPLNYAPTTAVGQCPGCSA